MKFKVVLILMGAFALVFLGGVTAFMSLMADLLEKEGDRMVEKKKQKQEQLKTEEIIDNKNSKKE